MEDNSTKQPNQQNKGVSATPTNWAITIPMPGETITIYFVSELALRDALREFKGAGLFHVPEVGAEPS